jgi:DeoR/GlpR family transcriptional regulator of sugar metabolism
MLTAERRQYILRMLNRDGKIIAKELSEKLGLSEDTIRRDLRDLADEGQLMRVHGGAVPVSPAIANFNVRREQAPEAKATFARVAARLVHSGQVVFLDGGTTNLQVAQQLPKDLNATIITNSPPVAVALTEHPNIDVVLLGGHLLKPSIVTIGTATLKEISMVHADTYFLGICSLHPELGISTGNLEEAYLKRAMIERSADVIALVAPEKLNTAASYFVGPLEELSEIITERSVADELLVPYQALGITVTRV